MRTPKFVELVLTCESRGEAEKISRALLNDRLIACAKFAPIETVYWWKGKIASGLEVLLVMESREDLFDDVEAVVTELHSYDTFVLQAFPIAQISKKADGWLDKELKSKDN